MTWAIDIPSTVREGEWENRGYYETRQAAVDMANDWFGADGAGRIVLLHRVQEDEPTECADCTYTHRWDKECPTHTDDCDGFCDAYENEPGCRVFEKEKEEEAGCKEHVPDVTSIAHVEGDVFDVWCLNCEISGSFKLGMSEQEVDW